MSAPRCTAADSLQFLIASPAAFTGTEAARVQPHSPRAPAPDAFNRLLHRLGPDPEELREEAEPLVEKHGGVLIVDDSAPDEPYAEHMGPVTRHWSGKPKKPVRGINRSTWLWTDGDRKIPVDYRVYSKVDGRTKQDHSWAMLLVAKARGFSPKYVLSDSWYAGLEDLKQVRDHGWRWLTRLRGNRVVTPEDRVTRTLDEVALSASGTIVHLRGYGSIRVFRIDAPDGVTACWATNDLGMDAGARQRYAEVGFAIEDYHRDLKQHCGVERCPVRASRARRNHIGSALRAFLRLGWHFFTTGIRAFEARSGLVRDAVRSYLVRPFITLPEPSTA